MEGVKFVFFQLTAMLFIVVQVFVLGAAFGAGAWIVWRALDRGAAIRRGRPQDGPPQRQPNHPS